MRLGRQFRKLFAARLALPSGRTALVSRLDRNGAARLRVAAPELVDDAALASWLIDRLVTDEHGRRFLELPPEDAAALIGAVLRMHEKIYGVPLFGGAAAPDSRRELQPTVRDFVRRYLAADEQFVAAIVEGSRGGP